MQSVVRSSFLVGALALATVSGLTACGDKVNVQTNPSDSVVTGVTVSPPAVTMKIGDKVTLAASVAAGAKITDHGVAWST